MFAVLPKVYCMSIAFPSARMETGRLRPLVAHYLASFGVKQVQNTDITTFTPSRKEPKYC